MNTETGNFGFGTGGPAYLWSWPMVFVGQMAVALCFMELAAKYPVAGSVYGFQPAPDVCLHGTGQSPGP